MIITSQPVSLTAVPGRDSTFSVTASASFTNNLSYTYQWSLSSGGLTIPIAGATSSTFVFDPLMTDTGKAFVVSVSALSAGAFRASALSRAAILTVVEDVYPYSKFDRGSETGRERFRRLRHLGYI